LAQTPNPKTPIPNPQSPIFIFTYIFSLLKKNSKKFH